MFSGTVGFRDPVTDVSQTSDISTINIMIGVIIRRTTNLYNRIELEVSYSISYLSSIFKNGNLLQHLVLCLSQLRKLIAQNHKIPYSSSDAYYRYRMVMFRALYPVLVLEIVGKIW